jgi:phosphatidylethanolamine-binding protein (PEBP) family uncharacterized protein
VRCATPASLQLPANASREQLLVRMEGHVLGHGELMGLYGRQEK